MHLIKIKLRYRAFIQASFMLSHKLGRTICIFPITAPTREYYRAALVGARARLCRADGSERVHGGMCPLIFWQYQKHKLFLHKTFSPLYIFGPSEGTAVALKGRSKCKWGSRDRFLRPFLMVMRLYESRGQYVLLYVAVAVGAATAEPSFHGGLLAA